MPNTPTDATRLEAAPVPRRVAQPPAPVRRAPAGGQEVTSGPEHGHGAGPLVIGLDLSAASSGVALPDGTTHAITPPKAAGKKRALTDDLYRLDHIAQAVEHALRDNPTAALAVIEDYAPGIRSAGAHRLAEIGGVVRLTCWRSHTRIALVNPMHLKIYATGSSKAEKRDMALAAYKRAGLEFATDDECDAWWLRAMGLDHLGRPPVTLPAAHRQALTKVAWPEVTG